MKFVCPHCHARQNLSDDRVVVPGAVRRCRICGGVGLKALDDRASSAPGAAAGWKPSAVYALEGLVAAELGPSRSRSGPAAVGWTPEHEPDEDDERSESILDELAAEEVRAARMAAKLRWAEAASGLKLAREPQATAAAPRPHWNRTQKVWFGLAFSLGIVIALLLFSIAYQMGSAGGSAHSSGKPPPPPPPRPQIKKPAPARPSASDAGDETGPVQPEKEARMAASLPDTRRITRPRKSRRPKTRPAVTQTDRPQVKSPPEARDPDLLDFEGSGRSHRKVTREETRPAPTDKEVYRELRRRLPEFKACNRRQKSQGPVVKGLMLLTFQILPDGRVARIETSDARFRSSYVFRCVSRFVSQIRFPAHTQKPKPFSFEFRVR